MSTFATGKDPAETAEPPIPNAIPSGANGEDMSAPQPMQAKNFLKAVEDLKAKAAPAANILNGGKADQAPVFNPYDFSVEAMVTDQSYRDGEFEVTVRDIPVGKPGPSEWLQVHPVFVRGPVTILEDRRPSGMVDNYYYVPPPLAKSISMDALVAKSLVDYRLYVMANSLGNLKVWLIKLPDRDGKQSSWARSEMGVAEDAKGSW
jgi:hypothetical protein